MDDREEEIEEVGRVIYDGIGERVTGGSGERHWNQRRQNIVGIKDGESRDKWGKGYIGNREVEGLSHQERLTIFGPKQQSSHPPSLRLVLNQARTKRNRSRHQMHLLQTNSKTESGRRHSRPSHPRALQSIAQDDGLGISEENVERMPKKAIAD